MIQGIGVDITDVNRIRALLERGREQVLRLIFSPAEREWSQNIAPTREASYVAGRLAAKEAVLKAIGTGIGSVSLPEVSIISTDIGQPTVRLHGRGAAIAEQLGIDRWHLSISHERDLAIAVVVAEQSSLDGPSIPLNPPTQ